MSLRDLTGYREAIQKVDLDRARLIAERNALIIECHDDGHSQASIATASGLSPGRVSQIISNAEEVRS